MLQIIIILLIVAADLLTKYLLVPLMTQGRRLGTSYWRMVSPYIC